MFQIRTDIEEVCRTQKNLESMYNSTFDGKTRQEISEEKQFVVAKLKRLQMELHSLIISQLNSLMFNEICSFRSINQVAWVLHAFVSFKIVNTDVKFCCILFV